MKYAPLLMFLCYLGFAGCGITPEDPHYISRRILTGNVKVEKKEYKVGEPIRVEFRLLNPSDEPYEQEVHFPGDDPDVPFQRFSFNTLHVEKAPVHLERIDGDEGFTGLMQIPPNEEFVFSTQILTAPQEGVYKIEVTLFWLADKKIRFKPAKIKVSGSVVVTVAEQAPTRPTPELEKALQQLGSPDWKEQEQAKEVLVQHAAAAAPLLVPLMGEERRQMAAMRTLIQMKQAALPALRQGCQDSNWEIRMRCVYALAVIHDPSAIPLMRKLALEDKDWNVRFTALRFLSEAFEDPQLVPLLIQALADDHPEIRTLANDHLTKHTQQDFEFDPTAPEDERQAAIERWQAWWQAQHPNDSTFK